MSCGPSLPSTLGEGNFKTSEEDLVCQGVSETEMLLLRSCRWPAQVLDERDPWIPSDTEPPRRGAIPVRFFGTYDFAWIESQRAICPFEQGYEEHSTKSKQKVRPGTQGGLEADQRVRQSHTHRALFCGRRRSWRL